MDTGVKSVKRKRIAQVYSRIRTTQYVLVAQNRPDVANAGQVGVVADHFNVAALGHCLGYGRIHHIGHGR
jgi:hypothetical protein